MIKVIIQLTLSAVSAFIQAFGAMGIGAFLRYKDVIDDKFTKQLSQVSFKILFPAQLFIKLARSMNIESLKVVWLLPVFALIALTIQFILARLAFMKCFGFDGVKRTVLLISVTFSNAGTLPLVFISALVKVPGLFKNLTPEEAENEAISYICLYMIPAVPLFWTIGTEMMRNPNEKKSSTEGTEGTVGTVGTEGTNGEKKIWKKVKEFASKFFIPPNLGLLGIPIALVAPLKSFFITEPPAILTFVSGLLNMFSEAVFATNMIVLGSNLMDALLGRSKMEIKPNEEMNDDIELQENQNFEQEDNDEEKLISESQNGKLTLWINLRRKILKFFNFLRFDLIKYNSFKGIFLSLFMKQIVMAPIAIGLTVALVYIGLVDRRETILLLVLMIEGFSPSAMSSTILCNLNGGYGVNEMSEILLWQYLFAPIPLIVFSTISLYIICWLSPTSCNF